MLGTLNTQHDCLLSMADCELQSGQMIPWWQTTVVSDELKAQRRWSTHRALLRYADSGVSLQDAVAPPLRTPKQIHEADRHTCRPRGREFSPLDQLMRHEGRGQDGQAAASSQPVDVAKFYLMVGTVLLAPLVRAGITLISPLLVLLTES